MKEKLRLEKKWAALVLSLITFLLFVSVSYSATENGNIETNVFINIVRAATTSTTTTSTATTASTSTTTASNVIQAHVLVIPKETAFCFPQTFVVKEAFGNVTCFIETIGINASQLDPNSLTLGIAENSTPGIPIIPGSVTYTDDFNNNNVSDLFVQFDFSKLKNYFAGLGLPGFYHYQISGSLPVAPFSFTQNQIVSAKVSIPSGPYPYNSLIIYYTSFLGNGGNIVVAKNFPISTYTSTSSQLTGYFTQRVSYPNENVVSVGVPVYSNQGYITVNLLLFKLQFSQSLGVVLDGSASCSSTTNSITICQGSGRIITQSDLYTYGSNDNIPVKTVVWIISPTATKIFGFDSNNNKILEIENIGLKSLSVTPNIS